MLESFRHWRRTATLLVAAGLAAGCGLLPHSTYTRPALQLPAAWQQETVTGTAVANREQWWKNFNDPLLDELIDRALRTNNDLAAAAIRVRRARLQARLTDTNLTPTVSVSGTSTLTTDLNQGKSSQLHSATGSLSYELDLWGKLARARDADQWEAEATEVDRQNAALALIGTTASAYWQVAFLNERIATAEASVAYAGRTLALVEAKYRAGAVSGIELAQARQEVASQQASLIQLQQQRTEARHALAIIFDQPPESAVPERQQLPDGPLPAVAAGLPADLLGRRPDLRAAEMRLREYLANVDATKASFYPSFTLTGSLGGSSTSLERVLRDPISTLGVGLVLPFIQWNTTRLTVGISETRYEEAVATFRQTLYKALQEVENALSARRRYAEEHGRRQEALTAARQAEQLAEARYRAGATGVQAWLDEQERRRTAETSLAENRLNQLNNQLTLYQAVGGDLRTTATP